MRVAFVLGAVARGGTEGQAELLVAGLRSRGVTVDVFVVEGASPGVLFAGAPVTALGPRRRLRGAAMVLAAGRLAIQLRRRRYDVIHSALARGYLAAALAVPRSQRPRTVSWRRNLGIHLAGFHHIALERLAARRTRRIVVNSHAVAEYWVAGGFVTPEALTVVPNALEPWRFDRTGSPAERRETLTLVAVGNLRAAKGHDVLIAAAARLQQEGVDVAVTIVGEGDSRAALLRQATQAGVRLRLPGSVADPRPWLEWSDVYVHPSRSEGSSNALAEAMAYGCAVVASDVGGIPEMLGEAGRLVPSDDPEALAVALADLARQPDVRGALGHAAAARARELYDLESVLSRYLTIYDEAACAA